MSELTGKNFLVDDKVRGKVTIIAPQPVTVDEAYQVFLSILEIQGFTIVPQGPITKIIPTRDVKDSPIPTTTDPDFPLQATSDAFVTQLLPLKYADANEIRGLLSPLVSKESSLLAYTPTNTLILTETFSNLARLKKIIDALDVEAPAATLKVRPLKHAAAEQLATAVQSALEALAASSRTGESAAAGAAPPTPQQQPRRSRTPTQSTGQPGTDRGPRIIPDTRTNSLVIIATREDLQTAENIITQLDIPTPEGRGQIHVYYLAHAKAEELAQVLTAQAGEMTRPTTPGQPGDADSPLRTGTGTTGTRTGTTGARTGTLGTRTTAPGTRSGVTTGTTASGITITADKPTNSLVITAPPEAYAILKEIIQKLDIRRAQVLVEGLIAEVSLQKTLQLGVEWRVIDDPDGGLQVFGSSTGSESTGIINSITANLLTGLTTPGFLIGALRNTISINGTDIANIPVILRAFQGDTDVNILSAPNLLTTDNEEAEIIIGEQRPFLRSEQDTPSGGVVSTSRTFEFRDTGITLRITPQISQGRTVRLLLFLEVTRFISESEVGAITTTKRTARTTLIVDDSQTIVIGGLIQDENNDAKTQVPCLGNVPVLGWAFKQTSGRRGKTNLLIFITPHIVTSPEDVERVTTHKELQSDKTLEIQEKLREGQPQDNLELLLN
jgi:general secretion pathway protein D